MTRVCRVTDIPRLTPGAYRVLFEELIAEVAERGYTRNGTSREVRNRCAERGEQVGRNAINFVLTGLAYIGRTPRPEDTATDLASVFAENAVTLCANARLELSAEEADLLRRWIAPTPEPPAPR